MWVVGGRRNSDATAGVLHSIYSANMPPIGVVFINICKCRMGHLIESKSHIRNALINRFTIFCIYIYLFRSNDIVPEEMEAVMVFSFGLIFSHIVFREPILCWLNSSKTRIQNNESLVIELFPQNCLFIIPGACDVSNLYVTTKHHFSTKNVQFF